MGRRARKRGKAQRAPVSTTEYKDADGNVLVLRDQLSPATLKKLRESLPPGASQEDIWQRRQEQIFERLAVTWTIYDLPIDSPKELLARYRMAGSETRKWVASVTNEQLEKITGAAG